ncbi:hypothetical protein LdCL_320011800 [Leishmania donovani]|uniref:Uncharacterized protein n=1 Tax=Leishmania donovani TaxID=5661 RepID=A0A3Q8IFA7_LEIDO|nr:hypothetical protein LdCL_320011800 [Leishmania donovani]
MLPRPQTYQAKPYVPVTSAAIDPYEEGQSFLVDNDRLDSWFRYVEAELQRYRSPFVAAEALLTELRLRSHELYQPERLYVSTALRILQACVPHLSKETAQVAQTAVHELLPCLMYTRCTPLTTSSEPSSSRGLEKVTQLTYAGAFRLLLNRMQQCQTQLRRLERHARVEAKMMDFLVHGLDHMWLKMCFYSWRTFCRQLEMRKARLRRRLLRVTANEAVPAFLRTWRQHAHTIALDAKTSRNSFLQKQVEALYPLEQEAKSRYDHLCEEIKEKNRLAADSRRRLEETKCRLKVLEDLIAETQGSLADHWTTWKECTRLMFDDIGELPGKTNQTLRTEYVMNITDTASALSRRARGRAGRMELRRVAQFLLFEGELGADADTQTVGGMEGSLSAKSGIGSSSSISWPVPHDSGGRALSVTSKPLATHTVPAKPKTMASLQVQPSDPERQSTVSATSLAANVNDVYWTVATVVQPVLTPLHLIDVLHHNEAHLNITLSFLSTVYSGGHCSLFAPAARAAQRTEEALLPLPSSQGFGKVSPTAAPKDGSDDGGTAAAAEDVKWGALMMQDVTRGMAKVQDCVEANEGYLLSVRQGMMMSELEVIQGYLEDLYRRWAATGVPLSQQKLESVWQPIVTPARLPILQALYPEHGITCFTELVHYVARVAEFSGCSLQALAERLDATYPYDTLDELRIVRRSDEATELFRAHAAHLATLLVYLKDKANSSQYHCDHLSVLLEQEFGLTSAEAADISRYARHEGGGVVNRDDIEWLLLFSAPYVDPSPFTSLLEKVARLLEDCTPFFQQLARAASAAT